MAFERNVFSTKDEIRNSVWRCDHQPILITLHDHYILFEDIMSETVIFYKGIVSIKKVLKPSTGMVIMEEDLLTIIN